MNLDIQSIISLDKLSKKEGLCTVINYVDSLIVLYRNNIQQEQVKREIVACVNAVKRIFPANEQGAFKSKKDFKDLPNDTTVIYIPQMGYRKNILSSIPSLTYLPEDVYTKKDFIEIAEEDIEVAEELFSKIYCLHPEAVFDEMQYFSSDNNTVESR